jgi:hypothetical protein
MENEEQSPNGKENNLAITLSLISLAISIIDIIYNLLHR